MRTKLILLVAVLLVGFCSAFDRQEESLSALLYDSSEVYLFEDDLDNDALARRVKSLNRTVSQLSSASYIFRRSVVSSLSMERGVVDSLPTAYYSGLCSRPLINIQFSKERLFIFGNIRI